MKNITIRNASIEIDIPGIVSLINPYETNPVSVDQVRAWFEHNPPGRVQQRLVAVDASNAVTGYSCIIHEATAPEHDFYAWLVVAPDERRKGTGAALWEASLDFLQAQGATRLRSEVLENEPASMAFAEQRGFAIDRRLFHSILSLATFEEDPYLPGIADLEKQGIHFCSLADFPDTPETRRKLYDLNVTNVMDIPWVNSVPWSFSEFEKFVIEAPWFCREGQLLAVDGEKWVGLSAVSTNPETLTAYNEHTGVLRDYRAENCPGVESPGRALRAETRHATDWHR